MTKIDAIARKYFVLRTHFDERSRRMWAATEAKGLGYGGVSIVSRATGISRRAIHRGLLEIDEGDVLSPHRIRRPGGGRKSVEVHSPDLSSRLESLIEPLSRGDPESPLRWTVKSTRRLAVELSSQGFAVSHMVVAKLLHGMNYSLQGNRKTREGNHHPDRNAQFEHINSKVSKALREKQPVISVDTKKKELIGNYANGGSKWLRRGKAIPVNGHDFPAPSIPRAYPYGVYDIGRNRGFVNIGTDHDTASFAVESIRQWWRAEGRKEYPVARQLMITADGGGSNGSRLRLWKWEVQGLSNELGLPIVVCHFPPGTSKWNKVEHRLFSFISGNWRGEPLVDYETVVKLISRTTTSSGLRVACRLDRRCYPTGRQISPKEMKEINLVPDGFHGNWNYTIAPKINPKL
jgi:hypothetical protein